MSDSSDTLHKRASGNVWDTEYCSPREAFSIFRDGICSTFMPWSPEYRSERPFSGRLEGVALENGSIARTQMSPIVCVRDKYDIAHSSIDGFYANFVLSGELKVEQAGRCHIAGAGDLVVYDSAAPVALTEKAADRYEDIAILVPKSSFSAVGNAEDHLHNVLLPRDRLITPLAACLACLRENSSGFVEDEWRALLDAFVHLLPLAAGCFGKAPPQRTAGERTNATFKRIVAFLDDHLASGELSLSLVARDVGVSSRYIHRLFAAQGTTFCGYVRAKRLDKVHADLLSPASQRQPIHVIAQRWGFNDLSGFNRAFRKHYGCSPRDIRTGFVA